jgi:imidazolonepropionase-like amidohydrolase
MMTPGSDPYTPQFAPEDLAAAVDEAHALGLRVAGHVLCSAGLRDALAAGVDTIEHCWTITGAGQDYDPALPEAMARSGSFGSVTAHWALRSLLEPDDRAELRRRLEPHRQLHAAGVPLVAHSDAGTPGTRFDEFPLTVEAYLHGIDVTMSEAVRAATATAADALGLAEEIGAVAPGRRADLVAFDGDLRTDPRALRRVRRVVQEGRVVVSDTDEVRA